jgi:NAD(P)-dependent dehydrogenase (short-subunit alcohol dehydrogenase family)
LEAYGEKVDALFNIAGVMDNHGSVDTLTNESWERCLAVNLTAPVELMREVIPIMRREKSGSIVNLASKAGTSGAASGVAYTASA